VVVFDSFGSNTQQPSYVTRALQASLLASFLQRLSVALVVVVFDSSGDPMGSKCLQKKKVRQKPKTKNEAHHVVCFIVNQFLNNSLNLRLLTTPSTWYGGNGCMSTYERCYTYFNRINSWPDPSTWHEVSSKSINSQNAHLGL
jgi:hypothetical protein